MKNKSGNTQNNRKGNATRSAGKQATGNRNKHLLAAERRRTDEPHGRLNKQNPVSPQNNELHKSKARTKQNAGRVKSELKLINETTDNLFQLRQFSIHRSDYELEKILNQAQCSLNKRANDIAEL